MTRIIAAMALACVTSVSMANISLVSDQPSTGAMPIKINNQSKIDPANLNMVRVFLGRYNQATKSCSFTNAKLIAGRLYQNPMTLTSGNYYLKPEAISGALQSQIGHSPRSSPSCLQYQVYANAVKHEITAKATWQNKTLYLSSLTLAQPGLTT